MLQPISLIHAGYYFLVALSIYIYYRNTNLERFRVVDMKDIH